MTISGYSLIRNGIKYDFPFLQSLQSILPLCDEFIIAVGYSDDGTRAAIEALNDPKIKIIDTVWDEKLRADGKILAQQSNIALEATKGDWAFYLQGDEVIHEQDLPTIRAAVEKASKMDHVEGLLLDFLNFYGSYEYLNNTRYQHHHEVRLFKNTGKVFSYRDAQGFRKYPSWADYEAGHQGEKLDVLHVPVPVFHYSYVRPPHKMGEKNKHFQSFWHDDKYIQTNFESQEEYDYYNIERVKRFEGTHPAVMKPIVDAADWIFDPSRTHKVLSLKDRVAYWIEDRIHRRIGEYRNYRVVR